MRPGRGPSLGPAIAAVRVTAADPDLRRLIAAWFAVMAGKWALLVTTLVIAYDVGGGPAVAILGLARFLTPAVVAPFAGLPAARWTPEAVLRATTVARALAVVVILGVMVAGLPVDLLYVGVALEAAVGAFTRPLHMALLPAVARTPAQLVAANVSSAGAEGSGTFVGPALAGALLVVAGPLGGILAVIALYALGALAVAGLVVPAVGRHGGGAAEVMEQLSAGVSALARHAGPRLLFLDFGVQTLVRGALTVLVVLASIELLGLGDAGVGSLNAAMGLGGLAGAVGAITLAGRMTLAAPFVLSLAAWGAPIALIGIVVHPAAALVAMTIVGLSNAVLDVTGFTLLQRLTPNTSRVAVFGLLDSLANAGVAVGSVAAPLLVDALGLRGALLATGLVLPITALVTWPLLRRIDEAGLTDARRALLLREDPLFAPLSLATVEHLAGVLRPIAWDDGAYLMRQGEPGAEYVLVDRGAVEVELDGAVIDRLGPGAGVGEIALLRSVPRTASVRAVGDGVGYALDRDTFLEAITGHRVARAVATERVRVRLDERS